MLGLRNSFCKFARGRHLFPIAAFPEICGKTMPSISCAPKVVLHYQPTHTYFTVCTRELRCNKKHIHPLVAKTFPRTSSSVTQENSDSRSAAFHDTTGFNDSVNNIPKSALYIGFAGAIPFIGLSIASGIHFPFPLAIAKAQAAYASCILTFLGAVHWGKELENEKPDWKRLSYSVVPSIYAWMTFALPTQVSLYFLSAGLLGAYIMDAKEQQFPKWYRSLRMPLSLIAVSCVLVTAYNTPLFP